MWLALVVLVVVSALQLGAQLTGASTMAAVTQVLLMPALAVVLWRGTENPRGRLVQLAVAALGFSWLGDTLPRFLAPELSFLAMVGSFLLAQLVYAGAFWPFRRGSLLTRPVLVIPYAAAAVLIIALCGPGAGPLLPAIIVYAVAIVMMAVLATGLGVRAGLGGAVFVVSDSLIALDSFGVLTLPAQGFWVMSTYLLAQLLVVIAVRARSRQDRPTRTAPPGNPGERRSR